MARVLETRAIIANTAGKVRSVGLVPSARSHAGVMLIANHEQIETGTHLITPRINIISWLGPRR